MDRNRISSAVWSCYFSKIVFLKSRKYCVQKPENTCCFFNYELFAPKIVYTHRSFLCAKYLNYPQFLFFINKISPKTSSHLFSLNNFLFTTLPTFTPPCTSVVHICYALSASLKQPFFITLFHSIYSIDLGCCCGIYFNLFFVVSAMFCSFFCFVFITHFVYV